MNGSPMTRRAALRFIPALGTAIIVPSAEQTATRFVSRHPDAELIRLGRQLQRSIVFDRETNARWGSDPDGEVWIERSFQACRSAVHAIEATPAPTVEGLRVKAQAVAWCHSEEDDIVFGEGSTTDVRLAAQIVRALLG